jgi:hypothetical protein
MGKAVLHKLVARGLAVGRPDVATRRSGLAASDQALKQSSQTGRVRHRVLD